MIVYNAFKSSFDRDVEMNKISDIIFNKLRELGFVVPGMKKHLSLLRNKF